MKYKMSELGKSLFGFTLTEVLIATGIVGIIAALVLPALVTHFRDEVLAHQIRRQTTAIQTALNNLVVNENKSNFTETMMYTTSTNPDYDTTSGTFIKKYLRVSKYYGDFTKNKDTILKECFADKYYLFNDNDKKEYDIAADLKGACAKLKNGVSICLTPQYYGTPAYGVIDLNGPKGPNIFGKDLYILDNTIAGNYKLSPVNYKAFDPNGESTASVATTDKPDITPDPDNPCEVGDYGLDCCKYYLNKGLITSSSHDCCNNTEFAPLTSICSKEITIKVDLRPMSCQLGDCAIGIRPSGTTAKTDGTSLTTLPAIPPNINLYCDGTYAGYISGSSLKAAIESNASTDVLFIKWNLTEERKKLNCGYSGASSSSGMGIRPTYSSVTIETGQYSGYSYGGYKWSISYY